MIYNLLSPPVDNKPMVLTLDGGETIAIPPTVIYEPPGTNIILGDYLVVIGLNACEGDDYDYMAYMVTIAPPVSTE